MAPETTPFYASATAGKGAAPAHRPHGHAVIAGRIHNALVFAAGPGAAVLVLLCFTSFLAPAPVPDLIASLPFPTSFPQEDAGSGISGEDDLYARVASGPRTFYDDPKPAYAVERRLTGWDAKLAEWL